jgi:hypothetical protein
MTAGGRKNLHSEAFGLVVRNRLFAELKPKRLSQWQ